MITLTPSYSGKCALEQRDCVASLWWRLGERATRVEPQKAIIPGMGARVTGALVCESRNKLMTLALSSPAEIALWIDDDIWWDPNDSDKLVRMLERAAFQHTTVVGVNYPTRAGLPTVVETDGTRRAMQSATVENRITNRPAARIGMGLVAMDLRWFRKYWSGCAHQSVWFRTAEQFTNVSGYPPKIETWGEDYEFCEETRERGGRVIAYSGFAVNNGARLHPIFLNRGQVSPTLR